MKRKLTAGFGCAMGLVMLCGSLAACGPYGNYDYEAIDPGTLAAPSVEFKSAEEDPAQNAAYRAVYPTMKKYDQPVTITVGVIQYDLEADVKVGTTPYNQTFNKIAEDVLGIKLQYKTVAASTVYEQKLNLAIAANDMPDMFFTNSAEMFTTLRDSDMLADLTDAYYMLNDNLLVNYQEYMPELITACMKEGKLYALPQQTNKYTTAQRLYLRKDWLEIAGVEAPTTVEEMISVGEAFLAHKNEIAAATGISANNVIPFSMHKDITYAGSYSAEGLFNAHGASLGSFFMGEDGQLYSSNTSPEAKAAVETMRTMYQKGVLDAEFTTNTAAQVQSFVSAGYVGMVFGEWWLPKDALGSAVSSSSVKGADWVWVDLPSYGGKESLPVVDAMLISGYNLVSSKCAHPEAAAKLINLFYDIYYNDSAEQLYGSGVLPSNGFYNQFVPVKIWDGMASAEEYKRVQSVFNRLYKDGQAGGLNDRETFKDGLYEVLTQAQIDSFTAQGEKIYKISAAEKGSFYCLKRSVLQTIYADEELTAAFDTLRNREKILHFADGYPYFVAYKRGISAKNMTAEEKKGWGIYHEMIDENGSYAYVVDLAEGKKQAKYDEFYGTALSSMSDFGDYITTQTSTYFTKMITGKSALTEFTAFAEDYNRNGGETIVKQVNAWYTAMHAFD